MNRVLWVLQWFLAFYFLGAGIAHFMVPEGLPDLLSWMYDLSPTIHRVVGSAEILGAVGLVLPGLLRLWPRLVVWAALGLIVVMASAAVWHAGRGEWVSIFGNALTSAVLGFVAYGRLVTHPIPPRGSPSV